MVSFSRSEGMSMLNIFVKQPCVSICSCCRFIPNMIELIDLLNY